MPDVIPIRPIAAERLWKVADVARFLNCSARKVYNLIPLGLPTVRLPGGEERQAARFDPDEVRAWAAARKSHTVLPVLDGTAGTPRRAAGGR